MMIKTTVRIGIAAVIIMSADNSEARLFNGYSIGANGGILIDQNRLGITNIDGVHLKFKGKSSTMGYLGIQGDFEMSRPNDLYGALGISINLPIPQTKSKTKSFSNVGAILSSTAFTLDSISLKHKIRQGISGDFTFAGGYNFCNQTVLYLLAGFRLTTKQQKLRFVETITNSDPNAIPLTITTTYSKAKRHTSSPILGAGFKTQVASKMTVGLDYKYSYGIHKSKYKFHVPLISGKIRSQEHSVVARASYHFYSL